MKKLYRKGTVHPSPPPPLISDQLSFLPHAILTLTIALSPQDREVLAYLISCSSNTFSANPRRTHKGVVDGDHPPLYNCTCFRCYMSYWVRWDSSPNHQLIHEIIDAFEDWLAHNNNSNKKGNGRKEKRNKRGSSKKSAELICSARKESPESETLGESSNSGVGDEDGGGGGGGGRAEEEEEDKGAVRRFVGFIGERIWGAWGQ